MKKMDELLETIKEKAAQADQEEKKKNTLLCVLAVVAVVVVLAGVIYLICRYLAPSRKDAYQDDFENEFGDDSSEADSDEEATRSGKE